MKTASFVGIAGVGSLLSSGVHRHWLGQSHVVAGVLLTILFAMILRSDIQPAMDAALGIRKKRLADLMDGKNREFLSILDEPTDGEGDPTES